MWNDINCYYPNAFICERHNTSINSTFAPTEPSPPGGCLEDWLLFKNKVQYQIPYYCILGIEHRTNKYTLPFQISLDNPKLYSDRPRVDNLETTGWIWHGKVKFAVAGIGNTWQWGHLLCPVPTLHSILCTASSYPSPLCSMLSAILLRHYCNLHLPLQLYAALSISTGDRNW